MFALRPHYCVVLVGVDGLRGGPSDEVTETLLVQAEHAAAELLHGRPPQQVPNVSQWRDAHRAFGAKPQRTRPSVEALLRRSGSGLPRIDRITDVSHGNGFDRLSAVADGVDKGVTYCFSKGYFASRTFTERPFTRQSDYAAGGNEPLGRCWPPRTINSSAISTASGARPPRPSARRLRR